MKYICRRLFAAAAILLATTALDASAQTVAVGKYRTTEAFDKVFLSTLRTVSTGKFTLKSSDNVQGTIQAVQMDKSGRHEFASLFVLVTKETDGVLIEATFKRNSGYMGGGKPAEWAKTFGAELKASLPDLKVVPEPDKEKKD